MSANPFRVPEAFDTCALAGEFLPGLAKVGAVKRAFKWDKKEAPGTQGDHITYRGSRLVDFVIELTMWEEEQIDEWDLKRPLFEPDAKKIQALDVEHPVLERQKVRSVVVAEIVELEHKGGGLWVVQLGVNEYKPPPKAPATGNPKGSTNKTPTPAGETAPSAQEQEIARLLAEAKKP